MSRSAFALLEPDVRRVWAAVRFVDAATRRPVTSALDVQAPGVTWLRKPDGVQVVVALQPPAVPLADGPAITAFEAAFDPLPAVPALSLTGRVSDPSGRTLPRLFTLALPRATTPAGPLAERFTPIDVVLDPSAAAPLLSTWAVLRVSLQRAGQPVGNAVLRVHRSAGGALIGRGLSDARGEALVIVAGLAQVTAGLNDLVMEREVAAELRISTDPAPPLNEPFINPDTLAERADVPRHTQAVTLASGRTQHLAISLP
jgi:hypothetical protein